MLKRLLLLLTLAFLTGPVLFAQVTTSTITGTVKDNGGQSFIGATVTATHIPSGTVYTTVTGKDGVFTLPNLRVGGPYKLTVNFVGQQPYTTEGFNLQLGEPYIVNALLGADVRALEGVVVTGKGRKNVNDKTGATTNVGSRQITTLPTISRSITDFTRLTPQASGNNIGGRDARYNNVTIDGANLNNNFGLSSDPLPGGGNNPISLDAIEEISVSIAPYDVRQSNFTGANIAAVTKSGTNTFKGTAYTYYRDQSMNGRFVGPNKLPEASKTKSNLYGLSFGGPIIKNKLFFFVNGEYEKQTRPPGTSYVPTGSTAAGNTSATSIDSLRKLSEYLASQYGYNTGSYDRVPNFAAKNTKLLGRIDWNINNAHKLTAKYSQLISNNDQLLNATSVPNGAASGANTWTSQSRFGANAYSFQNSNYAFEDVVRTASLELNSTFRNKFSNQLIATYTKIQTTRTSESQPFPFIDIIGPTPYSAGGRNNYMSVGFEPYSNNNDVKNNIFNVTDNFTYFAGKHTLTAGTSYEQQYVGNMFMPASLSYYVYGSLAEFMNPNAHPIAYALTYSKVPGKDKVYSAELDYGQLSFYAQDEFNINPRFRLIGGVRFERPIYPSQPIENPAISALQFPDRDGKLVSYSTGSWPKATLYASPRVSFRWDVEGNKDMIVRGGTGVYTGKLPFVYFTNMPTNSGMYQFGAVANASQLSQITFKPEANAWQSLFTTPTPTAPSAGFVLIDKNFKFPQVWRTNFGLDKQLGNGFTANLDILYTKDINAVNMRNANQSTPTGTVSLGEGVTRPSFTNTNTATRRVYNAYTNAVVLENNGKGQSFSITPQVSKAFNNGFYGSLAYTYTFAQDVTANPGSTAASTWSGNFTSGTQNDLELSYSQYAVPHRIIGSFSYRVEYLKHLASTFSIFYEGATQGTFSYIYGAASGTAPTGFSNTADINFDGNSSDLMYIPSNLKDINFIPVTVGSGASAVTYTAQQQKDAFAAFVAQDPYLSKHMGQNAERNGARYPFYHKVDFKYLQDIFTNIKGRKNTLQVSVDVTNFLNLLNSNWGIRNFFVVNNPLRATKNATTGEVRYQMATYTPTGATQAKLVDKTFINNISSTSTWGLQVGVRYIF